MVDTTVNNTDKILPVTSLLGFHNTDTIRRVPLLVGNELAIKKVPMALFGVDIEKDETKKIDDYTIFPGRHQGTEVRVFMPPSSGWGAQKNSTELSHT